MKIRILNLIGIAAIIAGFSLCTPEKKNVPITPETALQRYLNNGDKTYNWEILESYDVNDGAVKAYDFKLTSQTWRGIVWKHQLTVLVPSDIKHKDALLFITGGSVKDGEPNLKGHDDELTKSLSVIAAKNNAIVSIIRQVPNQPLFGDKVEDQIISYTLHNFKNDGDYTWPLLFPMVKSAMRAMDAVQEFSKKDLKAKVKKFLISGASKRGWTTWLTGASDKRVAAIAPMVIDVLNMPVSLDYQMEVWNKYSEQIEDYTKLEIPQTVHSEKGDAITKMIDPYSYRKKLTMPKMIFIGTIDEYWPVDAIKNYIDSIPGLNLIHYVPNAGHGLGDKKQALQALSSFFSFMLNGKPYPICEWKATPVEKEVTLEVTATPGILVDAILWTSVSEDRDFRDEHWEGESLGMKNIDKIEVKVPYPESGFKAFYVDLKYIDANGDEYVQSTRMFVVNDKELL